jgi:IS5 family transposase
VAEKRGRVKTMVEGSLNALVQARETLKAQFCAVVEHPFHVVKNLSRYRKVRYRGLWKNTAQLFTLFGLANLGLAKEHLLAECA